MNERNGEQHEMSLKSDRRARSAQEGKQPGKFAML